MKQMHVEARRLPDWFYETSSRPDTLIDLLRLRSQSLPDRVAYTFLGDKEAERVEITYIELERRARAVAASLQATSAPGERALLLYPPGIDFIEGFFGCLYAGLIAIPAYPPDPARLSRSLERLFAIMRNADASIALTTGSIFDRLKAVAVDLKPAGRLRWLATDMVVSSAGEWRQPYLKSDDLAFLQYTSGSTGAPRGVMLTHENLLHNAGLVYQAFSHTPEDKYVSWLPSFHDMGFMAGVLQPLYGGLPAILMSPVAFMQSPIRWLEAITRSKATTSGGPDFAYDLCVRKINPEQRARLDLSTWSVAFNGSEPVRAETLERFAAAFASCGFRREAFYPCYGLAEATLIVSGGARSNPPVVRSFDADQIVNNRAVETAHGGQNSRTMVGCGGALPNQQIVIANTESLNRCAPGEVGEIWVSGPSVAQGYWNRPEETAQTFRACLPDARGTHFLRTGDLGFLHEGELFIAGRMKDLIIIRGLNHYPQDIELSAERSHPAIRPGCGAAFSVEVEGEERLVVVREIERGQEEKADPIIESIRGAISEHHELQTYAVVLIEAGTVPKTSSGKIQRRACRKAFLGGGLKEIRRSVMVESPAPQQRESFIRKALLALEPSSRGILLATYIQEQVGRVLQVATHQLNARSSLIGLGIDSLKSIELKNRIESDLGVAIPASDFLRAQTVSELSDQLLDLLAGPLQGQALNPVKVESPSAEHPLSYIQKAIWFLHQLEPRGAAYNVALAAQVYSELDPASLRKALQMLVDRHPSLRTTFAARDGQPAQQVHEDQEVCFEHSDASALSRGEFDELLLEEAHKPFDLERGPLFRARLFTRSSTDHVLLLIVHHVSIDGWSFWILLDELRTLYPAARSGLANPLPPPDIQYADYVRWQGEMLEGPEGERLWQYWRRELNGELPVLDLPTDRPRPAVQTNHGASHPFGLDEEMTSRIKSLASAEEVTPYMVLLAAFQALLYRYTGQHKILVGSPLSGRSRPQLESVVGCFFNSVALVADFSGDPTFSELLNQVRRTVLSALDNQDYPSHLLRERLRAANGAETAPFFQVTFILQKPHCFHDAPAFLVDQPGPPLDLGGLPVKLFGLERRYARSELELEMIDAGGTLSGWLHYSTDLFDHSTVSRFASHFHRLLDCVLTNPDQLVSRHQFLTVAELKQLLVDWSNGHRRYADQLCFHQRFEKQAEKTPRKIAAVSDGGSVTFRELNEQSDRLADLIRELTK